MSNKGDKWRSPTLARVEADIAYFEARLSLFKDGPASCYREAELKMYRELEVLLTTRVLKLSRQSQGSAAPEAYLGRIEVEEILANEE